MRPGPAFLLAASLLALPLAPVAGAQDHEHATGPSNPMVKQLLLYLDATGGLSAAPAGAGAVKAGAASPDGTSKPVSWSVEATKRTTIDSSVFVELTAKATSPTLVAGGPDKAAFRIELALNGQPVKGASSVQTADTPLMNTGDERKMTMFLPTAELGIALSPGDKLSLQVSFFGLNPEGNEGMTYMVGGEGGSRVGFRLRMASLDEVEVPKEVGPWPIAPLEGFDFSAALKANPGARVVTLRSFQFGFNGAPVVVANGTKVILQMYVDESLSSSSEGHEAHGHGAPADLAWDANRPEPLHGFSLATYDPKLSTVLFDGLVVTMDFTAARPGNYTFLCTVFCGSGHGAMLDRLEVLGPVGAPPETQGQPQTPAEPPKAAPGPEVALVAAGLALLALGLRRRAP